MTYTADTVYGRRPWGSPPQQQDPTANLSYEQYRIGLALQTATTMTADEIRAIVTPPLPVVPFPPRYGYNRAAFGIDDVAVLDQMYERRDFSGSKSGYSGSSTPALHVW